MLSKICLLVGQNWYNSNRYNISKLSEALQRQGIETKILDFDQPEIKHRLFDLISQFAPDLTCSFNYCIDPNTKDFWWDRMRKPHLFMLLDPPFYSPMLFQSPYLILSSVDRNDCEEVRSSGFKHAFFLPHAIEKELAPDSKLEKQYDVVFLGTCHDYESVREEWQSRLSKPLCHLIEHAIDLFFSEDTLPVSKALLQVWRESEHHLSHSDAQLLPQCYRYLERYTRGKDRIELIRSIKNASVHVFGAMAVTDTDPYGCFGWSHYLSSQSNVTIHPAVMFSKVPDILKRSKIVLNSMPFFRDGSHERVFMALACGCLPVSSESQFLREEFHAGEEILFYQSRNRERINDLIDDSLARDVQRNLNAASGREKVMKFHTWDNRVKTLIEVLPPILERLAK